MNIPNIQGRQVFIKLVGQQEPKVFVFENAWDALTHSGEWRLPSNSLIKSLESGEVIENNSGFVKVWSEYIN